jgi:hypothetical protein
MTAIQVGAGTRLRCLLTPIARAQEVAEEIEPVLAKHAPSA